MMRELFDILDKRSINDEHLIDLVFLDTCFFIHTFEYQKEQNLTELIERFNVAITSFNVNEFLLKEHIINKKVREKVRKFLKKEPKITIVELDIIPGNFDGEIEFVKSIDPELLKEIRDASDAVLMAAAIKTGSRILTKDKHHLFTNKLENYLKKYNIQVYKDYHDILNDTTPKLNMLSQSL